MMATRINSEWPFSYRLGASGPSPGRQLKSEELKRLPIVQSTQTCLNH
jgi:hypothetical protein